MLIGREPTASDALELSQAAASNIPWFQLGAAFALCAALAVAAIFSIRLRQGLPLLPNGSLTSIGSSFRRTSVEDQVAIVQRLGLGPSNEFVILERGDQRYLLHVSQQGATEIDRYKTADVLTEKQL